MQFYQQVCSKRQLPNFSSSQFFNFPNRSSQRSCQSLWEPTSCNGAKHYGQDGIRGQGLWLLQAKVLSAANRTDLGLCHLGNCTFGKLIFGKLCLGSCRLGKVLNIYEYGCTYQIFINLLSTTIVASYIYHIIFNQLEQTRIQN